MSILDQWGKVNANSGTQPASGQNRPEYLERLEQSKEAAETKLSGLFTELGKTYYEGHEDDHGTEYEAQLTSIRETAAEIAGFERQAEEIVARRRCPACGAQLPEGSQFCNFCGVRLLEILGSTEQAAPEQRICPVCKSSVGPSDMFCISCGADLRGKTANGGV